MWGEGVMEGEDEEEEAKRKLFQTAGEGQRVRHLSLNLTSVPEPTWWKEN